jgi:8-hydroxy-5-deazaflavin:NADPH oxidoreductase
MHVAIIGTGNVGGALSRTLSSAGNDVILTSRTPADAEKLAEEIGARSVASNSEAMEAGDVVILAVPYNAIEAIAAEVGGAMGGKVVIDVTNRMGGDEPGSIVDGRSNAEQIQWRIPDAKVVKAFNTVLASRQADPEVGEIPIDGFVAASDQGAKDTVLELVGSAGMQPIDAGPLSSARILEAMGALNIFLNMQGGSWQSAWKLLDPSNG